MAAQPGRGEFSTPLQRQLQDGAAPPKATPLAALELARKWFNQGRRIDIQGLAAELGVSRVTLHRWVGTREQLLTEVLWASTDRALSRLHDAVVAEQVPSSHTAEVLSRWSAEVIGHAGVRRLQTEEGEMFARLAMLNHSEFQRRLIDRVAQLISADRERDRITGIDLEADELAYATVRITESFIHTPAITGNAPDPDTNARVLHALLR
ncbi:QsdR family transcriptional regulator [Amycolatopsis benzoatilytica]|uniref:QsdR family transcriptional regulator n=1 Tax=Amycolatopsis benzoatilytica TaxID=346045 RepID=UPI0003676CF8|nr:QsdR family transcriptional regulator [Amycolatopsis benzoatilytica]